jgi:hypothetical protein
MIYPDRFEKTIDYTPTFAQSMVSFAFTFLLFGSAMLIGITILRFVRVKSSKNMMTP